MSSGTCNRIPILSLFCGAGGLDLGFNQVGFRTVLAIDKDEAAVRSYNANSEQPVAVKLDLSRLNAKRILSRLSDTLPVGVIGGPPCQGFSRGNVLADPSDQRNRLPFAYSRILEQLQERFPIDFFVFENVAGLLARKHKDRWDDIQQRFRSIGFTLFTRVLDAQDYGTPQSRSRLFLIGVHSRLALQKFKFPRKSHNIRTVADGIAHLPEPTYFRRGISADDIAFHPNHWTTMPKSARFISQEFNRWRSFRRLLWNLPSPTVAYGNREIHIHPNGKRRLSILEAMLLQGFPESYRLMGNLSEQVTQVCNAVPPPVARALARSIRSNLSYDSTGAP